MTQLGLSGAINASKGFAFGCCCCCGAKCWCDWLSLLCAACVKSPLSFGRGSFISACLITAGAAFARSRLKYEIYSPRLFDKILGLISQTTRLACSVPERISPRARTRAVLIVCLTVVLQTLFWITSDYDARFGLRERKVFLSLLLR